MIEHNFTIAMVKQLFDADTVKGTMANRDDFNITNMYLQCVMAHLYAMRLWPTGLELFHNQAARGRQCGHKCLQGPLGVTICKARETPWSFTPYLSSFSRTCPKEVHKEIQGIKIPAPPDWWTLPNCYDILTLFVSISPNFKLKSTTLCSMMTGFCKNTSGYILNQWEILIVINPPGVDARSRPIYG